MMTDTAIQQSTDTNGQTLVTQAERQALIQKLRGKWPLDSATKVENVAYEKSHGIKPIYFKLIQTYYQQVQNANNQNRLHQQQQQALQSQSLSNNGPFVNQQINLPQQSSTPGLNHPQLQLNHLSNQQSRFPSPQQSLQSRMPTPQSTIVTNQSNIPNQGVLLREPQKFNQSSYTSSSVNSIPTNDLSQNYASQQQITNPNLRNYLTQPLIPQNRYPSQSTTSLISPRLRPTTNLNGVFSLKSSSNNSNDVLHQFVVGNPPTNSATISATNTSSSGDRLLQQILLSNNDGSSNKMSSPNRQSTPQIMSQPIRSASTTNSNLNPSVNFLRSSLTSQQTSSTSSPIVMPTSTPIQTLNVPIQPPTNVPIQQSPLNSSNGSYSANLQAPSQPPSITMNNSSTPLLNNYSSPITRSLVSSGNGSISSPDEETVNLIKLFKENLNKLQFLCQKCTNEGNTEKARNIQSIHQQMVQFINNPTHESLSNAKHIRDLIERASNRSQQPNIAAPIAPIPQVNELKEFEKALTEYISRDSKTHHVLHKLFVEPLSDVINGVPHKKIRLDVNDNSNRLTQQKLPSSSLLSHLNNELNSLPPNRFSIECLPVSHTVKNIQLDDDYLNKNGIVLRCKLLESSNPIIPPLRLRISTRYPEDQPEILSLTETLPPKLEFTDGHPFFEQLSTIFVSHLFKLPSRHTVTDILNIWYQSVQDAL